MLETELQCSIVHVANREAQLTDLFSYYSTALERKFPSENKNSLTLFDMTFFLNRQSWGGEEHNSPHHNFLVIAPMIMNFGTSIKLYVFYTKITKTFVTSLLLRSYDVITCILADA